MMGRSLTISPCKEGKSDHLSPTFLPLIKFVCQFQGYIIDVMDVKCRVLVNENNWESW
jgi:hypothetical protein